MFFKFRIYKKEKSLNLVLMGYKTHVLHHPLKDCHIKVLLKIQEFECEIYVVEFSKRWKFWLFIQEEESIVKKNKIK